MDLVVLSEVRWGYFRTRKQFLLSRFPERWRVFFAQPPGSDPEPWTPQRDGNVTFFTVPFLKPGTKQPLYNAITATAPGRALIERVAEGWLARKLDSLGVERDPVVMVSNIYGPGALARMRKRAVFYDFNDSPFQFAGVPEWSRGYWDRTWPQADALFVVSEYYRRELARTISKPLITLGNGVEFDRFAAPTLIPDELAQLPQPRIGYIGLLSHFLDFEALEALRQARRGGTLVLIGPGSPATDARVRELAEREGVAVLGARPYERIPPYFQGLDVGVIPFRAQDPYVQGINPNKVYQFLASGRPVITTPVLDLAPSPPCLQFASSPAEMVGAVEQALDARVDPDACRALARPYDWGDLAQRMVSEIERRIAA